MGGWETWLQPVICLLGLTGHSRALFYNYWYSFPNCHRRDSDHSPEWGQWPRCLVIGELYLNQFGQHFECFFLFLLVFISPKAFINNMNIISFRPGVLYVKHRCCNWREQKSQGNIHPRIYPNEYDKQDFVGSNGGTVHMFQPPSSLCPSRVCLLHLTPVCVTYLKVSKRQNRNLNRVVNLQIYCC